MQHDFPKQMALCGVFAALAVVIMCLGSFLLVATFVCPVICCLMLKGILGFCGRRMAWAWYGAVSVMCLLLCPDKEAAAVFLFFGYYPIFKPWLDTRKLSWLWRLVYFNGAVCAMYGILIYLLGMTDLMSEFKEMGYLMLGVTLVLGNILFFLLDKILGRRFCYPGRP